MTAPRLFLPRVSAVLVSLARLGSLVVFAASCTSSDTDNGVGPDTLTPRDDADGGGESGTRGDAEAVEQPEAGALADAGSDAATSVGDAAFTPGCATNAVWTTLDACGWPGPKTTGYPAGTAFGATHTGGLTIITDGTVIDGQHITGGVVVQAKNVVIRNSWISNSAGGAGGSGVVRLEPGASATIEHTTLDGQNATHACIWHEGAAMTARYDNCYGVNDGMFSWATTVGVPGTGDNFTIERNYLHDFTVDAANGHIDGYQTEGASHGVIRHNTFDITQDQNASVAIWNGRANSEDILIDDNLMAGSGFSVYVEDYSPSESSPAGGFSVTNVRLTNNKFSTTHFGCVGYWGVWYPRGNPTDAWKRTGNVVLETGQSVDNGNPTYKGTTCN